MQKKKPKFGVLPTVNMPKRSFTTPVNVRPPRSAVNEIPEVAPKKCYSDFKDLVKRVKSLKILSEWILEEAIDRIVLTKKSSLLVLPKIQLTIDDRLGFSVSVFGWFLPDDHAIHIDTLRSVMNITVSELIKRIAVLLICPGVRPFELSSNNVHHIIPKSVDPLFRDDSEIFPQLEYWRTRDCEVLVEHGEQCCVCYKYSHKSEVDQKAKQSKESLHSLLICLLQSLKQHQRE